MFTRSEARVTLGVNSRSWHAIEEFLRFMSAERAAAGNTVAAYRSDLRQVADHMMRHLPLQGGGGWESVERGMVQDFVSDLEQQGYAQSSVERKMAAMRSFFTFLVDRGVVVSNPTDGLSWPRPAKISSRVISLQELGELRRQSAKRRGPEAKRDQAILEVLCATGIRVSELVSLDVRDVRQDLRPEVRCRDSRTKDRTVPLSKEAAEAVRVYLDEARTRLVRNRYEAALFVNQRGQRLTRGGVWLITKRYAEAAGLGSRISPQAVRRSVAAHLLRGGTPPSTVQEMLGHGYLSSTQVYLSSAAG